MKKRPHNFADLTGQRFGRLEVVSFSHMNKFQKSQWLCNCDCGSTVIANGANLKNGGSRSCGCIRAEALIERSTKHGMAGSKNRHPIYIVWTSMKSRCLNKNEVSYKNYGDRGIAVCDEWLTFENFANWALEGYKPGLEIDRIDNDAGYSPENCRWVTTTENQNNKRNNVRVEVFEETKTVAEWSEITGIKGQTIRSRLRYGWTGEDLIRPVNTKTARRNPYRNKNGRYTRKD